MHARPEPVSGWRKTAPVLLHVAILIAVSISFESAFLRGGLNLMDEGWPLHAAMEMHQGGTMYDDVFWVFPPGHAMAAWVGYAIDPPGIVLTRKLYAAFNTLLCLAIYFIARRVAPPEFALLAGLMVAIAAPASHWKHLLFGYRYLVFSAVALLCFARRLDSGNARWLLGAGIFAATSLWFRVTPAFAVSVAIGIGVVVASRDWQSWLRDWLHFGVGLLLVSLPLIGYFAYTVGLETLWIEMMVRPVEMTNLQQKPMPPLILDGSSRKQITLGFTAFAFRFYILLYAAFVAALALGWWRNLRQKRDFEQVFLLTVVLWGGIYFVRSLGRSDEPHLDSAFPPIAILIAVLLSRLLQLLRLGPAGGWTGSGGWAAASRWAACAGVLVSWGYLISADLYWRRDASVWGYFPVKHAPGGLTVKRNTAARTLDRLLPEIKRLTKPGDTILPLTNIPLVYVLAERESPGNLDFVMPGTFRSDAEELAFVERMKKSPPALVLWPTADFDRDDTRGVRASAPRLGLWIRMNYRAVEKGSHFFIMLPRNRPASEG